MNPADMAHSIDKFYGEVFVPGMAPVLNHALWSWLAGYFMVAAFVLLCAILFKSYKVLKTIAVYLGLSLVLGNLQTIFFGKKVLFLMEGIETQSAEQAEYIPMQIFDGLHRTEHSHILQTQDRQIVRRFYHAIR